MAAAVTKHMRLPWYEDDAKQVVAGLVELSIILPEEMPHYDRG